MYLMHGDEVIDFDLELLSKLLTVIDNQLESFEKQSESMVEAEFWGELDWAEHVVGHGFIAWQTYLSATYPITHDKKHIALNSGPIHHESGERVVALINASANYWKHHVEWLNEKGSKRQERIRSAFESIGYSLDGEYPLSGILTELTSGIARFRSLLPQLVEWRNALIQQRKIRGSKIK